MRQKAKITVPALLPLAAALLFLSVSCGPSAYLLDVEMRRPSAAGVDIIGKAVSVVYMDNGIETDSIFAASMSSAFASRLEQDYFAGDSLITLFCLDQQPDVDYSDKENMVDLLVDTGSDVLFLFNPPVFADGNVTVSEAAGTGTATGEFPFSVRLYVYDSMDRRDTVLQFSGSSVAKISADIGETVSDDGVMFILKSALDGTARNVGTASGEKFSPRWKAEEIVFFVYDSSAWYDTYYYVQQYQWQKAMDIWMSMLDTGNLEKKACIEYNMAAVCYILGQHELSSDWLELSEKHFDLSPYTGYLKKKIEKKAGQ